MKMLLKYLSVVVLIGAGLVSPAWADEAYVLKPDRSIAAVLSDLSGKSVTLHLRGGERLGGKLGVVGTAAVQLTELNGKEFYDAVVAIEAIDAVEVRARSR